MAKKTFKIGEVCRGGVITAETTAKTVTIISKEWDTSGGYSRAASQENAKELNRLTVNVDDENAYRKLDQYLSDLSTSYWADKILVWVKSKSKLDKKSFW
jgi:hypothetical protein